MGINEQKTYNANCDGCGEGFSEDDYENEAQLAYDMYKRGWIELPYDDHGYSQCFCRACKDKQQNVESAKTLAEIKAAFGPHIEIINKKSDPWP